MATINAEGTVSRVNGLLRYLGKVGIARHYQRAVLHPGGRAAHVSFPGAEHVSAAMKNQDYRRIYRHFVEERAYSAVMLDNAIVQIMYRFEGRKLMAHRLAFFPAPKLEEFQNVPEWYLRDEVFVDVVARTTTPTLVRFDYDASEARYRPVTHPKSHLTLGRYEGCRIPVSAPLTPDRFMDFVLRNFYDTTERRYSNDLSRSTVRLPDTIDPRERGVLHVAVPA